MKLALGLAQPLPVGRVEDKDDGLSIEIIMLPQRPKLVLSSNIPESYLDILKLQSFNIGLHCLVLICITKVSIEVCKLKPQPIKLTSQIVVFLIFCLK